ncbi:hypothetical protein RGQ29_032536, partial [Quercus rubra]
PWKLFKRRLRIIKLGKLCPIHEGMLSTNSFSTTSIVTKYTQFLRDDGMLPLKLLFAKFRTLKLFHLIQQSCIFLDKLFF